MRHMISGMISGLSRRDNLDRLLTVKGRMVGSVGNSIWLASVRFFLCVGHCYALLLHHSALCSSNSLISFFHADQAVPALKLQKQTRLKVCYITVHTAELAAVRNFSAGQQLEFTKDIWTPLAQNRNVCRCDVPRVVAPTEV